MRVTVRLKEELASHVDAVRQGSEQSDAEAVRTCIERSQRLDDIEADREDEIQSLKDEIDSLRDELKTERSRADRAEGKLESVDDRLDDKDERIESLEQTIDTQSNRISELTSMAAAANKKADEQLPAPQRGVLGGIRARLFGDE